MSNATSSSPSALPSITENALVLVDEFRHRAGSSIRATAFWVAVLLPLTYLPTLHAGLAGEHPLAFVGVLSLNLLCAIVGHDHSPTR